LANSFWRIRILVWCKDQEKEFLLVAAGCCAQFKWGEKQDQCLFLDKERSQEGKQWKINLIPEKKRETKWEWFDTRLEKRKSRKWRIISLGDLSFFNRKRLEISTIFFILQRFFFLIWYDPIYKRKESPPSLNCFSLVLVLLYFLSYISLVCSNRRSNTLIKSQKKKSSEP